ncbi:hypothetical protein NC653_020252 [Populus alba x Populus x berolinensis]|uniref:Uncharacterized protein n=1 Tax=Populus alba x Populus x berolinensis TaxID=444605 RepID=A0AAD6QCD2_9ROSI|nr:hypothetical protein NC653_020252 [Populus alba x Populus x berolinensis]
MLYSVALALASLGLGGTRFTTATMGADQFDQPNNQLMVQFLVIGVDEAFHFPGQVALYYQEFPKSLRSTSTAMISLLIGIGYYLSKAIIDSVRRSTGWLPDNINDGRLDYVFWLLTAIAFLNFGYYLLCTKLFKYQNTENHENEASA